MERKGPDNPDLLSWKEVAQYLGCSVRTAQKWEKERALPVHRMPGTAGQVMAKPDEIEHWKERIQKHCPWWTRPDFRAYYAVALPLLLLVLAAHDVYYHHLNIAGVPAAYRNDSNELVILDDSGREIWRKLFDAPVWGRGESPSRIEREDTVKIVDLHGDGIPEVLYVRAAVGFGNDVLHVFGSEGEELWTFEAPNQRRSDFLSAITSLAISPAASNRQIFVLSCRSPAHLSTLHAVDALGNSTEIFEHEGHLDVMDLGDVDRDGDLEIVVGGTDNRTQHANLHLLDATLGLQSEILFPRSELNLRLGVGNRVVRISAEPGHVRVGVEEWMDESSCQVCYLLDEKLKSQTATPCGGLQRVWMRFNEERGLKMVPLQEELVRLQEQIRIVR